MMNIKKCNGTNYNKYINNNKINNFPITSNYIINYFNHYYPFNVFIHRDINHFITLFFQFFHRKMRPGPLTRRMVKIGGICVKET